MDKIIFMKIKKIKPQKILNSRGDLTVEVILETEKGVFCSSAPSGASAGKHEAKELNPEDAIKNIKEKIAPEIEGKSFKEPKEIDGLLVDLDGTEDKSKLGVNAVLPVSMASFKAGAASENLPLYKYIENVFQKESNLNIDPAFNIINGGVHAGDGLGIQEFMAIPEGESLSEKIFKGAEIYKNLKEILRESFGSGSTNLGDEGGFVPPLRACQEVLEIILAASKKAGVKSKIALDCAASQFYQKGKYYLQGTLFTKEGLVSFYKELLESYPIVSLEDPFAEDDWEAWEMINSELPEGVLIIGDDLTVTNPERIKKAKDYCSGLLLKPNQIGTVSEAVESFNLARSYNWKVMVSHRSGDTCDDFIADLAVGLGADFIKAGAPARGERTAKYNRLLEI